VPGMAINYRVKVGSIPKLMEGSKNR